MLCEYCRALRTEGYEYPESYCLIQPEENWRDFKAGPGCSLRWKTIQRKVEEYEEMEGRYYDALAKSYALEELEKDDVRLGKQIDNLKECLGLFDCNCPKPRHSYKGLTFNLLKNQIIVKRTDAIYEEYRSLELCGLVTADKAEDYDFLKKKDMDERFTFWVTKVGFDWLAKRESTDFASVKYKFLQGPVRYLTLDDKKQAEAYKKREKIKVGDQFIWQRTSDETITSGKLRRKYMYSPNFPYTEKGVLEVYKVYEGKNGYGPFVDYWLKIPEKDPKEYHIIINAVSAMKMQRKKEEE